MHEMPRRTFVQSVLATSLVGGSLPLPAAGASTPGGLRVPADQDRLGQRRKVFGALPIDVKVAGSDTDGRLLLIEQIDTIRGGPPRHLHHGQEEWFYVVEGSYAIEVGEERFQLGRGDSVLAPRGIPHVWAHVGEGTGRMLIGFQPAGRMEAFFAEATMLGGIPAGPELARLFHDHDMELLGPPLKLE
jgi:mannose-6-phosphate isomerase-like protein (cupin superfamily)